MKYIIIFDTIDMKYHIVEARNELKYPQDWEISDGNYTYVRIGDLALNSHNLCGKNKEIAEYKKIRKASFVFGIDNNSHHRKHYEYYFKEINGHFYIYSERKVIMIFSSLFYSENEMCHKCFLEFIREACNKKGSNIR